MRTAVSKKYIPTDDEVRAKLKLIPRNKLRPFALGFIINVLGPKRDYVLSPSMRQFALDILKENRLTFP